MRTGLIGYGYWGKNWGRVLSKSYHDLEWVFDPYCGETTRSGVRMYTVVPAYKDVDAVVIATPPQTHYGLAKQCLELGLHCLVEKPLAMTTAQCEELCELAQSQDLTLMTGHTFLYSGLAHAYSRVPKGIGDPYLLTFRWMGNTKPRAESVTWTVGPHPLSILSHMFPEEEWEVVSAWGYGFGEPSIWDRVVTHLHGWTTGLGVNIELAWDHPQKLREIVMIGDAGAVIYHATEERMELMVDGGETLELTVDSPEALTMEYRDFRHMVISGENRNYGERGAWVTHMIEKIEEKITE